MARLAPGGGASPSAERRLRKLIHRHHQRSDLSAHTQLKHSHSQGVARVTGSHEVVVMPDGSNLGRPYRQVLKYLDTV